MFPTELKIQSVTHDSIEDARTALALYQKYCQLKASGDLVMELQNLYEAGKKAQWKVPGEEEEEWVGSHFLVQLEEVSEPHHCDLRKSVNADDAKRNYMYKAVGLR